MFLLGGFGDCEETAYWYRICAGSLVRYVCLFAGWLSAHWEEITHLCVRFVFSWFGSGHGEETKETTWSFITTVWFVGSVHLGRDY